jgi:hypothetical protein
MASNAGTPRRERRSRYFMINVLLPPELDEYLQRIGNEARKKGGYHLPKTMLLRAMARVL